MPDKRVGKDDDKMPGIIKNNRTINFLMRYVSTAVVVDVLQAVKEKETLRRSYFLFIAAVVTNDVTIVLTSQSEF